MKILLTGSSGYLGAALSHRLQREGHQVFGLDVIPSNTTTFEGSISDRKFVSGFVHFVLCN